MSPLPVHLAAELLREAVPLGLAASAAAGVSAAAASLLRGRWPRFESALWGLVLLRLVLPLGLEHPWSLASLACSLVAPAAGLELAGGPEDAGQALAVDPRGSGRDGAAAPTGDWPLAAFAVWILLSGAVGAALYRGGAGHRRLLRGATPLVDPRATNLARAWEVRLALRRRVSWRLTDADVAPFTTGLVRPVVVLPRGIVDHPSPQVLEAAVAHELVHVRRWDALRQLVERLILVAWAPHPAAWVAVLRRGQLRERVCDRVVVEAGMPARRYAGALLRAVALPLRGGPQPALLGGRSRKEMLMRRLESVLAYSPPTPFGFVAGAAVLVVVGALVLPAPGGAAPSPPAVSPVAAVPGPELSHPLPGASVTSGFGPARDPFTSEAVRHRGVDLRASRGTPVAAPADGLVVAAVSDPGDDPRGRWLELEHADGWSTVFTHLEELAVEAGQRVERGQSVGRVGSTGRSTGPHLHFEVRRFGEPVDPATVVIGL